MVNGIMVSKKLWDLNNYNSIYNSYQMEFLPQGRFSNTLNIHRIKKLRNVVHKKYGL